MDQKLEKPPYMDGYLKTNLGIMKDAIKEDWDMVIVVDGIEGSGKSVLAQQVAKEADPSFNIDRIVFNPKKFVKAIEKAGKYEAIVYDEAYGGLNTRQVLSQTNRALVSMMAEIRQKNLFVIIVLPCFFELDKYVAVWRSRALIHVYTDGFKRGLFRFYNQARKKNMYINGKKTYDYRKGIHNFHGRFLNQYTVDEAEYRAKKLKALHEHGRQTVNDIAKQLVYYLMENHRYTGKMVENAMTPLGFSLSERRYQELHKEIKDILRDSVT